MNEYIELQITSKNQFLLGTYLPTRCHAIQLGG